MFILLLRYTAPLGEVKKYQEAHKEYLNGFSGNIVCQGKMDPRTGGVIICRGISRGEAEKLAYGDPYYIESVASYEIIEFVPTKYTEGFGKFI